MHLLYLICDVPIERIMLLILSFFMRLLYKHVTRSTLSKAYCICVHVCTFLFSQIISLIFEVNLHISTVYALYSLYLL